MMKLCALLDLKAGSYSPVVAYPDLATAERSFISLLSTGDSTPAQWPEDFVLYCLGDFDPSNGSIVPLAAPVPVLNGQSAMVALNSLRRRFAMGKGGAVGETAGAVSPEDKAPTEPDGSSHVSESASYNSTPDLI